MISAYASQRRRPRARVPGRVPIRNQQQGNPRFGGQYRVQKAPGGSWHVYANGKRVFVRAGAPRAPSAPSAAAAPTIPTLTAPPPSVAGTPLAPLGPDASYLTGIARLRHQINQRNSELSRESTEDKTNYEENLRRLNEHEPVAGQRADESFNQQGLFYSGKLGEERGNIAKQYARQRADALQGFQGRENARAEARRALEAGYSIEEAAEMAAAADRQLDRDQGAADAGYLVANEPEAAAAPGASPAAVRKPRSIRLANGSLRAMTGPNAGKSYVIVKRGTKRYRKYSDGRLVPA